MAVAKSSLVSSFLDDAHQVPVEVTPNIVSVYIRRNSSKSCGPTIFTALKGKGSPYLGSRVPELIPVLGSQPAGDVSHKPGGRLPLLFARPTVTPATLKRAATNFAAW